MGDPYFQRDWMEKPVENVFNASSVIPGIGMFSKLAKAPKTLLPAAQKGAGFVKGLGQGKTAGLGVAGGAGVVGQNLKPVSEEEKQRIADAQQAIADKAVEMANQQAVAADPEADLNNLANPQVKVFNQMAGIAGDDDPLDFKKLRLHN